MPFQNDYSVLLFKRIVCETEHIFKGMSAFHSVVVSFFFVLSVCEDIEFYLRLCSRRTCYNHTAVFSLIVHYVGFGKTCAFDLSCEHIFRGFGKVVADIDHTASCEFLGSFCAELVHESCNLFLAVKTVHIAEFSM